VLSIAQGSFSALTGITLVTANVLADQLGLPLPAVPILLLAGALVLSKFVPGISSIAPPMAGALRMRWWRFLYLTVAGSASWTGAFLLAGMLLGRQIRQVLPRIVRYGGVALAASAVALAIYVALRWYQRHRLRPGAASFERTQGQPRAP
jgi:membrane protein DedA with SNARE-associated domain